MTRFFGALLIVAASSALPRAQSMPEFSPAVRAQLDARVESMRRLRELPAATAPKSFDLREQFPADADAFDQGEVNVCHDFAAASVIEAALFRATGEHFTLSPADLFLGNTLLRRSRSSVAAVEESDSMLADIGYALDNGVVPESAVPYAKFLPAYLAFKASEVSLPEEKLARRQKSWSERFYSKQDSWWPGRLDRQRRAVKAAIKDFTLVRWLLPSDKMAHFAPHSLSPAACAAEGREQGKFLLDQLAAHRPVAIGFDAAGLPGPAHDATAVSGHAAVVDAVHYENGRPVFSLLNAWGDSLRADQLCRIDEMGAVVTPKD
jgi:hypothetical protein